MSLIQPATFWDIKSSWKREDGKLVQKRSQDVEGYLERNKREQRDGTHDRGARQSLRKVASVPNNVYMMMMRELDIPVSRWFRLNEDDLRRVFRKLNSPEYAYLRTTAGKL
jgi:hypothetical protein